MVAQEIRVHRAAEKRICDVAEDLSSREGPVGQADRCSTVFITKPLVAWYAAIALTLPDDVQEAIGCRTLFLCVGAL